MDNYFLISLAGLFLLYVGVVVFLWFDDKMKVNRDIKRHLKDKIWDIPVELQCQYCKEQSEINFDLQTIHFDCPKCKKQNKIMLRFITVAEDPLWKED